MIIRAAATVRQPILVCRKSINLTDFTNNKMTFYIVLIGLFELLNIILYKVVKEYAKETPKERGWKPKPNKSGHSPLSPTVSPLHSFSLPPHPHRARFYRYAVISFFDSYILFCLTSFTAVHLICGLAISLRVHSFVLFIFEYVSFQ